MTPGSERPPTDAQLAILNVLWDQGPATVREVHDALQQSQSRGYTTTLKLMQLMAEKGLVQRDESARSHVYRAGITRTDTLSTLVRDLREKAFGGSAAQLVLRALSDTPASAEELDQIRRTLDQLEGREDNES